MTDEMIYKITRKEWEFSEYRIDSTPNPSLYPLQQGKVHKSQVPVGDYQRQGEIENDKTASNNDSKQGQEE